MRRAGTSQYMRARICDARNTSTGNEFAVIQNVQILEQRVNVETYLAPGNTQSKPEGSTSSSNTQNHRIRRSNHCDILRPHRRLQRLQQKTEANKGIKYSARRCKKWKGRAYITLVETIETAKEPVVSIVSIIPVVVVTSAA